MKDIDKRLVEVDAILNKLDDRYKRKIPKQFWKFIKNNKNNEYIYYFQGKARKDIHIDTICILTYVNIRYLMNNQEKQKMIEILKIDKKANLMKDLNNNKI